MNIKKYSSISIRDMEENNKYMFSASSFFMGMFFGLIIKWTDIIPILGGLAIGISIKKMPEFISIKDLPGPIRNYLVYFGSLSLPGSETKKIKEEPKIKAK